MSLPSQPPISSCYHRSSTTTIQQEYGNIKDIRPRRAKARCSRITKSTPEVSTERICHNTIQPHSNDHRNVSFLEQIHELFTVPEYTPRNVRSIHPRHKPKPCRLKSDGVTSSISMDAGSTGKVSTPTHDMYSVSDHTPKYRPQGFRTDTESR